MENNTQHAPAERADWEELHAQLQLIKNNSVIQGAIESCTEPHLILNSQRQIVFANAAYRTWLEVRDPAKIVGCRPGEVIHCIHASEGEGGCGTSKHCRICGAVNAVLKSIRGEPDVQKCSVTIDGMDAPLKLIVFTTPVTVESQQFVLLTVSEEGPNSKDQLARQTFTLQKHVQAIEAAD